MLPHAAAAGVVGIAVLIRLLLGRQLGTDLPFITLFPAIFVVAFFFGFGPAVVATGVSLVVAFELFLAPRGGLPTSAPVAQLGSLLFGLTGLGIGWLGEARLRARRIARDALGQARSEGERAEAQTLRAEEEAARAEEETLRAEEQAVRAEH